MTKSLARFALSASAVLLAAALAPAAHAAPADKTLTAVLESDVRILDPSFTTIYITRTFGYMVYDTLFGMNAKGEIKPQMVDRYDVSPDSMRYTFTLRPGLKFHDGQPVTAEDVVASLQRWGQRDALGKQLLAASASLTADDDKTVTLKLKEPFGPVLQTLGKPAAMVPFIMPARLAKTPMGQQVPEIIGSGPFVFLKNEWKPGSTISFERFKDYVPRDEPADLMAGGKVARLDRVVWKYIPDGNTALSALQAGEVDYVQYPSFDMLPILETDSNVQLVDLKGPNMFMGFYRLNSVNKPMDDPAIRAVVAMAVDQSKTIAALGVPERFSMPHCATYYICGSVLATDAGSEPYAKPSVAAAREALKKTRYAGEKIVILQATDIDAPRVSSEVLAQTLREVGFNVELQSMDWNSVISKRASKDAWHIFGVHVSGYDMMSPLTNLYIGNNCQDYAGWNCDARITKDLAAFRQTSDPAEQKRLAADMQKVAYETTPAVIWGQFSQPAAYRKNLKGVIESSIPVFWNISK
ncbi:Glutathione-binding protein gsiB precursor [Achromobacter denitrificans]|uniref:ABC transporter substrate-binding protein n=1 Tax=Achromobacter denitrificans TaxID=32002 RepID=UPI000786D6C0|nr:ABC transporter substrate-binding protein [Achromobacter denitrificans]OLU10264.1 substrate-binding protein [Achromobacter denitrificans]QKH43502.1 ABC transporter substrate-binding protein [Achromobacter denitrificans]QKH49357.1 ABC transporter substrate-binding protein [Achromobacter denitrificans]CAB3652365.1 Glutathione-binding protein GsiB [Achromobacter denitrificans]SUU13044.1 Glutathione-binding protein gsiB precursor [Achromobacter denitrificans]